MPIVDLQRRLRQAGRIRIGDKGGRNGAPRKLTTFRLTSTDRSMLDQAAQLYGGTVEAWDDGQWQVTTERDALDVIVPPTEMAFSQWYEAWSGGGCVKRCDGQWDMLNDKACSCNPDERDCTPHTRLSVMLRDLPGVGTWRIDTQGFYAATELLGAVELIQQAATSGRMLPARLLLDRRTVKRITNGKSQTRKFVVPVLDVDAHMLPALSGAVRAPVAIEGDIGTNGIHPDVTPAGELEAPSGLTPVPASTEPGPTIAEQAAAQEPKKRRSNAAAPLKGSGRSRRKGPSSAEGDAAEPSGPPPSPEDGPARSAEDVERAQRVAMMVSDYLGDGDDERHAFLLAFSQGRYSSSYDVTPDEMAQLRAALVKVKRGELTVADGADGPILVDTKSGLVPTRAHDESDDE